MEPGVEGHVAELTLYRLIPRVGLHHPRAHQAQEVVRDQRERARGQPEQVAVLIAPREREREGRESGESGSHSGERERVDISVLIWEDFGGFKLPDILTVAGFEGCDITFQGHTNKYCSAYLHRH